MTARAAGPAGGEVAESSTAAAAMVTVHEIFTSIQGETTQSGRPCTFVRLTGCDLRCAWCDTEYAFSGGSKRGVEEILAEVRSRGVGFVTVTGGEPLLQRACPDLVAALLSDGFEVQVETGGHRDVDVLDRRSRVILDLKAPGSGESHRIHWPNVAKLLPHDEVKIVLADRADYEWARGVLRERLAPFRGAVLFQPVTGLLPPADLAAWILEDRLAVRLTIQLHQLLWPGQRGV